MGRRPGRKPNSFLPDCKGQGRVKTPRRPTASSRWIYRLCGEGLPRTPQTPRDREETLVLESTGLSSCPVVLDRLSCPQLSHRPKSKPSQTPPGGPPAPHGVDPEARLPVGKTALMSSPKNVLTHAVLGFGTRCSFQNFIDLVRRQEGAGSYAGRHGSRTLSWACRDGAQPSQGSSDLGDERGCLGGVPSMPRWASG